MEKRIATLPAVRVGESLEQALMRGAAREERTLSEYIWRTLWRHEFGHAAMLGEEPGSGNQCRAEQRISPGLGMSA